MKICLGFPLWARVIEMNHQFLVVSRERDCLEYTEEEGRRTFGGNRDWDGRGRVTDNLRVGLSQTAFESGF